jgi:hypothetical protein
VSIPGVGLVLSSFGICMKRSGKMCVLIMIVADGDCH